MRFKNTLNILALGLVLGMWVASSSAQANIKQAAIDPEVLYTQDQLIALFKSVCLAHFPDADAVAREAERQGFVSHAGDRRFKQFADIQWSIGNTSVSVVVTTKGKDKYCQVDARHVPIEGLAQTLAQEVSGFEPTKLRIGAGGRRLTGQLIVNGARMDLKSVPSGSKGSPFFSSSITLQLR